VIEDKLFEKVSQSKKWYDIDICTSLSGNIAETLLLKEPGLGSSSDLFRATSRIRDYIVEFGFCDFHQHIFDWDDDEDFWEKLSKLPPKVSEKIVNDTETLLEQFKNKTTLLVNKHKNIILKLKDFLLKPEHKFSFGYWISGEEANKFVRNELKKSTKPASKKILNN